MKKWIVGTVACVLSALFGGLWIAVGLALQSTPFYNKLDGQHYECIQVEKPYI